MRTIDLLAVLIVLGVAVGCYTGYLTASRGPPPHWERLAP